MTRIRMRVPLNEDATPASVGGLYLDGRQVGTVTELQVVEGGTALEIIAEVDVPIRSFNGLRLA